MRIGLSYIRHGKQITVKGMESVKKGGQSYLRNYLNTDEGLQYITIGYIRDVIDQVLKTWKSNVTKEERTHLKYVETYAKKWFFSIKSRLDEKQLKKLERWVDEYELTLADREKQKKIEVAADEKLKNVTMPRESFENWCSEIMNIKCKNCTKEWVDCDLHDLFLNNAVPESTHDLKNCRYAYLKIGKKVV